MLLLLPVQVTQGVKPTLSELQKFEASTKSLLDLKLSPATAGSETQTADGAPSHSFTTGDVVEVSDGELKHLIGTITKINLNKVTIQPKHQDLKVPLLSTLTLYSLH